MILVLDASVILKWLLADPEREPDTTKATALLEFVFGGKATLLQPTHWLPEVAAVLVRLSPQTAQDDVEMLAAMELPTNNEAHVLRRATTLAIETGQHLFDTLYHAVALEQQDATLITADERYRLKAMSYGRVMALHDWVMA
jgi:predicted nucleic acid-binding protein